MLVILRLTVLFVASSLLGFPVWAQCNQNCPERHIISVNGTGSATADADKAVVRVGYKLYGPDARSAYAAAMGTSNAIMDALIASGIEKGAIESTSQVLQRTPPYDLQPYPGNNEERKSRQFTVVQGWIIRVKPDQAGKALDTAVNAGANESGWIQWIVDNPSALQAQASAAALANARTIAEQMAQKAGVPLGKLVSVLQNQSSSFNNGAVFGVVTGGLASGMGGGMGAYDTVMGGNQQLAINSRRVVVNITVNAVFSIE